MVAEEADVVKVEKEAAVVAFQAFLKWEIAAEPKVREELGAEKSKVDTMRASVVGWEVLWRSGM